MRVYLVVTDESAEALKALRFASHRAMRTGGSVHMLALVRRENFTAFGAVQATIEQEARDRAEVLANAAAGHLFAESGRMPVISVQVGDAKSVIRDYLAEHGGVAALVLGAAADGAPGPLVQHFATQAGQLPCPLYVVPGALDDAEIDRLA